MPEEKHGSRAQRFARTHDEFLKLMAEGFPPLVIGRRLGLNSAVLGRHCHRAMKENVPYVRHRFMCLTRAELPDVIAKALPGKDSEALVKIEVEDGRVVLSLLEDETAESVSPPVQPEGNA